MKKILAYIMIAFLSLSASVFAQNVQNTTAVIQGNSQNSEIILFKIDSELNLSNGIIIPPDSKIKVEILDVQNARRWHKSAYLVSKLKGYSVNKETNTMNQLNDDIYLVIRKYQKPDKIETAKKIAEIGATTTAGFMLPGVDVAYYFAKGVIKNDHGDNRFKSGVSTAYENSIFWFWLKGKSLDLDENSSIKLQEVNAEKADKLLSNIENYKEKEEKRHERKEAFKEFMSY